MQCICQTFIDDDDSDDDAQWLAGANFDTESSRVPMSEEELKMSFKIVRSVQLRLGESK